MAKEGLPRGARELDSEQVKWRVLKLKEILGITKAGPFMYTAAPMTQERHLSYKKLADEVVALSKGPFFVHYHQGTIVQVAWWAFERFWGTGQYYCTIFDASLSWFVFTDDNSEDTDRAIWVSGERRARLSP